MFKHFENFIYSSTENFPVNKNVIQGDEGSFCSNDIYMVLCIDIRSKNTKYVTYAKPYINRIGKSTLLGWKPLTNDISSVLGNIEMSASRFGEQVVGFIPVNKEEIEREEQEYERLRDLLDPEDLDYLHEEE